MTTLKMTVSVLAVASLAAACGGDDDSQTGVTDQVPAPSGDAAGAGQTDEAPTDHDGSSEEGIAMEVLPDATDGVVIDVEMVDFGFDSDVDEIPIDTPVTFHFHNGGEVEHEAMFGSAHQQDEFMEMTGHGDHEDEGHDEEDVVEIELEPGESGDITIEFHERGELWLGCHLPGHWAAGMSTTFTLV